MKLQSISRRLAKMRGFTMVELMIVIAIIGIIAVAVLSAINPIEQINKGKDTRVRSDASEMLNALERMYATDEKYPFYNNADGDVWAAGDVQNQAAAAGTAMTPTTLANSLVTQKELKDGFNARIISSGSVGTPTYNIKGALHVLKGISEDQVYMCFLPSSAQFQREANTKCITGSPTRVAYGAVAGPIICNVAVVDADAVYTVANGNLLCMP